MFRDGYESVEKYFLDYLSLRFGHEAMYLPDLLKNRTKN